MNAELQNQVTNSGNIVIEVDSNRDNNENFYNEEVTVQYSIPTRSRRRSLPTPPSPSEDPNVSVKVTVNNRQGAEQRFSALNDKFDLIK